MKDYTLIAPVERFDNGTARIMQPGDTVQLSDPQAAFYRAEKWIADDTASINLGAGTGAASVQAATGNDSINPDFDPDKALGSEGDDDSADDESDAEAAAAEQAAAAEGDKPASKAAAKKGK